MNELISKQKAIDEIKEFQSQVTCDFSKDWLNGMDEGFAHSVNVIELIDTVEAIPVEYIESTMNRWKEIIGYEESVEALRILIDNWKIERKEE